MKNQQWKTIVRNIVQIILMVLLVGTIFCLWILMPTPWTIRELDYNGDIIRVLGGWEIFLSVLIWGISKRKRRAIIFLSLTNIVTIATVVMSYLPEYMDKLYGGIYPLFP